MNFNRSYRFSAGKSGGSGLSQECDCDRIEQLCQQLEQVSKERDDALETLRRVRDTFDYATKHG